MGLFRRNGGGNIGKGLDLLSTVADTAKKAVTDKDKLYELQYAVMQARTELMLSGKGAPITKISICGLVALVVCVGAYVTLRVVNFILGLDYLTPESVEMIKVLMGTYKDYALPAVAVIGLITGGFVTGTSLKRKWSNGNGN